MTKKEFVTFLIPLIVKNQKGKFLQCNLRLSSLDFTKHIFLIFIAEILMKDQTIKK